MVITIIISKHNHICERYVVRTLGLQIIYQHIDLVILVPVSAVMFIMGGTDTGTKSIVLQLAMTIAIYTSNICSLMGEADHITFNCYNIRILL